MINNNLKDQSAADEAYENAYTLKEQTMSKSKG